MRKTILVLLYFFSLILVSAFLMIFVSQWVRGNVEIWLVRQVAPHAVFSVSLFAGICLYRTLFKDVEFSSFGHFRVMGFMMSAFLGVLLFALSIFINNLIGAGVSDNSVHSIMPPLKFYPYLIFTLLLTGLIQPVLEEVIFRGAIFPTARREIGVFLSILVVSLFFAAFHYSFFITSFIFSIAMCLLKLRFNLLSCVVAHSSHNICTVLIDAF